MVKKRYSTHKYVFAHSKKEAVRKVEEGPGDIKVHSVKPNIEYMVGYNVTYDEPTLKERTAKIKKGFRRRVWRKR